MDERRAVCAVEGKRKRDMEDQVVSMYNKQKTAKSRSAQKSYASYSERPKDWGDKTGQAKGASYDLWQKAKLAAQNDLCLID